MRIDEVISQSLWEPAVSIKRDCGPFLAQIKGRVDKLALFRGVSLRYADSNFSRAACLVDRYPVSTDPTVHEVSDSWFEHRTGIKFRSNAVFASGDAKEAGGYGVLFAIFPIGKFEICYSPVYKDLFQKWSDFEDKHGYKLHGLASDLIEDEVDNILRAGQYRTSTLTTAIKSMNEIMIHCDEYYQLKVAGNYKAVLAELYSEISQL